MKGGKKLTGSIEKRGKDSYRLVVFKGYDLDGKSIRHQKTIHLKNSLKYGNVIMDKKNLLHLLIIDI